MKRIISILTAIILLATTLAGCSGNQKAIDFIYPFSANIRSFDPQVAETRDEFLLIENTFEGLIRIDDEGNIQNGMAESYNISNDGLTYTFKIREGMKWDINTEKRDDGTYKDERLEMLGYDFNPDITANDFVFALQRACEPLTDSPMFASLSCIENANSVHKGLLPSSKLGVSAKDTYTLEIKLSSKDNMFLSTLSTAVAMPCNQEFFNATKGRYGLERKYTLFNGQFYLSQILESSYLLKANEYYTGEFPAIASELTLKIVNNEDRDKTIELLQKGYYDAVFLDGFDTEKIKDSSGITYTPYNDTTWAFILNSSNEVLQSKTMREAFALGLTRLNDTGKEYLANADCLTPSSCVIGNESATKAIGKTTKNQDIEKSVELWKKGLEVIDQSNIELTVKTTPEMEEYVKRMLQGIQSGIGAIVRDNNNEPFSFTVKLDVVSEDELKSSVSKREFEIAFYPFKSESNSALTYLKGFSKSNSTGFDTAKLTNALAKAERSGNAENIKSAETAILNEYTIVPMLYETSYYASANGVSGIQFHAGTGRVSFVNATREE